MKKISLITLPIMLAITFTGSLFTINISKNKTTIETVVPTFTQADRALGETAMDEPLRVCGGKEAVKLLAAGEIDQNTYTAILKDIADSNQAAYQFMDFRTLTRGTIPWLLQDQCRLGAISSTVAISDTNGSGLPSVAYFTGKCDLMYFRNTGGGRFSLRDVPNFLKPSNNCAYHGLAFVDVNNDKFVDLVSLQFDDRRIVTLLNDGKGDFLGQPIISTDVEKLNGLIFSVNIADLSKSGRDDIIVANRFQSPGMNDTSISSPVRILRNTGVAPYFKEDTSKAIPQLENNWTGRSYLSKTEVPNGIWYASYALQIMDFDGDGYPDIMEIGDGSANHMLWSNKGVTFKDLTYESGIQKSTAAMGVTPVNLDGGDSPMLFVSDAASTFTQQCEVNRDCLAWHGNRLYQATPGKRTFTDIAEKVGLSNTGWAFGAIFADLGNNGYPQLVVGTGDIASGRSDETFQANFDKPYLYTYTKEGWTDTSYSLLRALKATVYTNKVAIADFDGDGRNDLLLFGYETKSPYLLLNRGDDVKPSSSLVLYGSGKPGESTYLCSSCRVKIAIKDHKPYTLWYSASQSNFGVLTTNTPMIIGFGSAKTGKLTVTFADGKSKSYDITPGKHYQISE